MAKGTVVLHFPSVTDKTAAQEWNLVFSCALGLELIEACEKNILIK
jgi:hypothetical protein